MTVERIAVGIDFSEPSLDAARWTAQQFPGAELVLVHVIAIPEAPPVVSTRYPRHELLVETAREGADRRLRALAESMRVRCWPEIHEGETATLLPEIAARYDARLIVVGAHGERPRTEGTLGSTAQQVVRTADIPVLLVAGMQPRPVSRILVAVDDPALAVDSVRWAARFGDQGAAHVTMLHVTPAGVMTHALAAAAVVSGVPTPTVPHVEPAPQSDRWLELVRESGVPTERLTSEGAFGDAATEILAAGDRLDVDLIVMGRRKSGGLRRAVLGSVTDSVLRHARRNVLVVPERPGEEG